MYRVTTRRVLGTNVSVVEQQIRVLHMLNVYLYSFLNYTARKAQAP